MKNLYTHRITLWTQHDEAEILERLDELRHITAVVEADKINAVARARQLGITWEEIGDELNMSRQAAWERWHHLDH
jgi:hypothetical protein